jgi:hypothetical protein
MKRQFHALWKSYLRIVGVFLLNVLAAAVGTAMVDETFSALYRTETITQAYLKEILLSSIIAFALGVLVFYKWKVTLAKWVWVVGAAALLLRLTLKSSSFTLDEEVGGWAGVTFICFRTIFYSFGAFVCAWKMAPSNR